MLVWRVETGATAVPPRNAKTYFCAKTFATPGMQIVYAVKFLFAIIASGGAFLGLD
jgi:hypothetical protein